MIDVVVVEQHDGGWNEDAFGENTARSVTELDTAAARRVALLLFCLFGAMVVANKIERRC